MLVRFCFLFCLLSPVVAAQVNIDVIERYQVLHRWLTEDSRADIAPIARFYQQQKGQGTANKRVAAGLYLQACLQFQKYVCGRDLAVELLSYDPTIQEQSQLLNLAIQLSYQTEQYSEAMVLTLQWQEHLNSNLWKADRQAFPTAPIQAEVDSISAYSAYHLKMWNDAEHSIVSAIDKWPTQERYQFLLAVYQQSKSPNKANSLLKKLTKLYPQQKKYWLGLSYNYLQQNQQKQAIAVLSGLDDRHLLDDKNILLLAQLMITENAPLGAAQVLLKHQSQLKNDMTFQGLMLKSLLLSRQHKKALSYLEQHPNEPLLATQTQLAYSQGEWAKALPLLTRQISTEPQNGYWRLLRGISYFELQQYDCAAADFKKLSKGEYQTIASQWLHQVHYLSLPIDNRAG